MKASWITVTSPSDATAQYVFEKRFTVNSPVHSFLACVSADTRYRLYINGIEVANGPCKSAEQVKYFEQVQCAHALVEGENILKAVVLHATNTYGECFNTAIHKEKPAFYFDGTLVTRDGTEKIVSDERFCAYLAKHIRFTFVGRMRSLAPFEVVEGEESYTPLKTAVLYTPNLENNGYSPFGVRECYPLQCRPIQLLEAKAEQALAIVREYYDESGSYNILLDAGRYTTAMLRYEYCAPKDTKINLIYAECTLTRGEDGSLYKDMRDNVQGEIVYGPNCHTNHYDTVIASGKEQTYEPFFYRAFRFIRVECSQKPACFQAFAGRFTYDFEKDATAVGSFTGSDEKYEKAWSVSRNTLECCTHETFVDCPFYEQQQYIADGRYESLCAWRLSNDSKMQRKLLLDTAHSLQINGDIAGVAPSMNVVLVCTYAMFFVDLMRQYLRYTGDVGFVQSLLGVQNSIIECYQRTKTKDGVIHPREGLRFVDWVSGWSEDIPEGGAKTPICFHSMIFAASLKTAAEVCEICGRPGLAADYRQMHAKLIADANRYFYDEEAGLYADIRGKKVFSEHANVWAILADAVTGEAAIAIAHRMMQHPSIARSSYCKSFDLLRALEKVGCYEQYAPAVLSKWNVMLEKHCTTWMESASFPRSECHGWSCAPMYEMSAMVLGVFPLEDGFKKVRIKPVAMGLSYAEGRVPTPYGYIDVAWRETDGKFSLEVVSSEEIQMEIHLPGGKTETICGSRYSVQ